MTKQKYIILLVLIFAFSCKKDKSNSNQAPNNVCMDSSTTATYLDFWKSEFLIRDTMTSAYFNSHISQIKASANCYNSGISFRVDYKVTIDWAVIDDYNQFIVELYSSEPAYQYLNIPRDQFLGTSVLQTILNNSVEGSYIGYVKSITSLPYSSNAIAIQAFQDSVGSSVILPQSISYYVPGKLPHKDGYPYFLGFGTINDSLNQCIEGYFNLVTGQSHSDTTVCRIQ
jgi:hypothetical protein